MDKTLTYEQMMALFAEGHKETAELRSSIAESSKKHEEGMAELRAELRSSIAESDKKHEEGMAELRSSIAESNKKHEEGMAELRAELRNGMAELRSSIADLRIIVNENNEKLERNTYKVGLLTSKLGGVVESIVIPGIVGKFNEKGFSFDSVSTRVEFLNEEGNGNLTEVDALLENGKFVIAVEAKTDMKVSDVNKHIKRLDILRGIPRFKGKKIYGAFSTAVARKKPVDYALENGFYVLQQPDVMGVRILDFPKGHCAKAW